jgi:hypothetical protein
MACQKLADTIQSLVTPVGTNHVVATRDKLICGSAGCEQTLRSIENVARMLLRHLGAIHWHLDGENRSGRERG